VNNIFLANCPGIYRQFFINREISDLFRKMNFTSNHQ